MKILLVSATFALLTLTACGREEATGSSGGPATNEKQPLTYAAPKTAAQIRALVMASHWCRTENNCTTKLSFTTTPTQVVGCDLNGAGVSGPWSRFSEHSDCTTGGSGSSFGESPGDFCFTKLTTDIDAPTALSLVKNASVPKNYKVEMGYDATGSVQGIRLQDIVLGTRLEYTTCN